MNVNLPSPRHDFEFRYDIYICRMRKIWHFFVEDLFFFVKRFQGDERQPPVTRSRVRTPVWFISFLRKIWYFFVEDLTFFLSGICFNLRVFIYPISLAAPRPECTINSQYGAGESCIPEAAKATTNRPIWQGRIVTTTPALPLVLTWHLSLIHISEPTRPY